MTLLLRTPRTVLLLASLPNLRTLPAVEIVRSPTNAYLVDTSTLVTLRLLFSTITLRMRSTTALSFCGELSNRKAQTKHSKLIDP